MIGYLLFVIACVTAESETCTGGCKDILQGYLTGQASSVLGTYQIEVLKREFKSFTGLIEKSMNTLNEKSSMTLDFKVKLTNSNRIYSMTSLLKS